MDKNRIIALKSSFDGILNSVVEAHIEFWYARDLMGVLGYTRWENFAEAIKRAETSCLSNNVDISFHFRDVTKMISLPNCESRRGTAAASFWESLIVQVTLARKGLAMSVNIRTFEHSNIRTFK